MQKVIIILLILALLACGAAFGLHMLRHQPTEESRLFAQESDALIQGLQEYRKFTGSFPAGSAADIANEISGNSSKKVLVLAAKQNSRNARGEVLDPWGTPLQFFFSPNAVLIRSAGPNRRFEDAAAPESDDLVRTDARP